MAYSSPLVRSLRDWDLNLDLLVLKEFLKRNGVFVKVENLWGLDRLQVLVSIFTVSGALDYLPYDYFVLSLFCLFNSTVRGEVRFE